MDKKKPITESDSLYDHLEEMPVSELLENINTEDQKVAGAVKKVIPEVTGLVEQIVQRMRKGGRLFYLGAGTSGRLGVVDASECPPTFGVAPDRVIGLIAGGEGAIRASVERAEDDPEQGWKDLQTFAVHSNDAVVGIAASGRTPYVIGALRKARASGILTGCITCNEGSDLAKASEFPIEVLVGPEFVTGSTRMKAGTAQKMILNMISTATMIQLGHVKGNRMVDMQLSNQKLVARGTQMIVEELGISENEAVALLQTHGSVRLAVAAFREN